MSPVNPPCLTGGSRPPWGGDQSGRIDGYAASVFCSVKMLQDELQCLFESAGFGCKIYPGQKPRSYENMLYFLGDKDEMLSDLKWGGRNQHPHIESKGIASALVAEHLKNWMPHQVSRVDHALDLRASGLFDRMLALLRDQQWCAQRRVSLGFDGDWATPDAGRTLYIGAKKSAIRVRIYEKGLKYAADMGLPVTDELRQWVRFEVQVRPGKKSAKLAAANWSPEQIWGASSWTSQLAEEAFGMTTQPVSIRERRESHTERALRFMGSQYSKHLRTLLESCDGDMAEFGSSIAHLANLIEHEDAA